jgi:hypothetical protein
VIDERRGCALLRERFEAVGLSLVEGFALRLAGRAVHLDGYDPARRVGFEYVTTEAGDRAELTADVLAELEERMAAGELYVLLVDEREVSDEGVLTRAAEHFLRVLAMRGVVPGRAGA